MDACKLLHKHNDDNKSLSTETVIVKVNWHTKLYQHDVKTVLPFGMDTQWLTCRKHWGGTSNVLWNDVTQQRSGSLSHQANVLV